MKIKQNNFQLIFAVTLLALSIHFVNASESPTIHWNETAQSAILNNSELVKLGGTFLSWKEKQMTWPSPSEITSKAVVVDPNLRIECHGWVSKFIKNDQLPMNLEQQLVPMKEWGVIRKESEQKRLCDVFIVRYKKGDYVVHIQESPYNVVITVADEKLSEGSTIDHKDLVIEMADLILDEALKPNPASENFHLSSHNEISGTTCVTWAIDSLRIINDKGQKVLDLVKASNVGTTHIDAETNGKFVRFEISKCPGAVKRAFFDPYTERFNDNK